MAKAKKARGKFIVLEGIDGAGTTTQSRLLEDWMTRRGELVHRTNQPSTGPLGTMIRQILSGRLVGKAPKGDAIEFDPDAVALLFAADRLDHIAHEIRPHLDAGRHVICDRYVLSSLAYQSLSSDLKFVRAINNKALAPDLTLFLKVRADIAMSRIEATRTQRDTFENIAFQQRVAKRYATVVENARDGRVVTLDGELDTSVVATHIRNEVERLIG